MYALGIILAISASITVLCLIVLVPLIGIKSKE